MKKHKKWIIVGLLILVIIIGFGGKQILDKQAETKEIEQEKQIALQAKKMFKDIKEIEIVQGATKYGSGYIGFNLEIQQKDGNKFNVGLDLGELDSGSGNEAFNQRGKTENSILLIYSNGEREKIK